MSLNIVTEIKGSKGLEPVAGNGNGRAKFDEPITDYLVGHTTKATAIIADRDGILFHQISSASTSGVTVTITINGNKFYGSSNTYAPGGRSQATVPIRKGDIIYGDVKGFTVSNFYPFQEKQVTNLEAEDKYSTDEIVIGEWIDGRPIYRCMMNISSLTTGDTSVNVSNIDTIIKNYGSCTILDRKRVLPFKNGSDSSGVVIQLYDLNTIQIMSTYNCTNVKWFIEYTKTTD